MHDSDAIKQEVQRLRYWHGQMLHSRDFQDQIKINHHLHWWHNRAVHQAYGVSTGLEVSTVLNKTGQLVALNVEGGIAYDCSGRELILQSNKEIEIPQLTPPGEYTLMLYMHHKKTFEYSEQRELPGVCLDAATPVFLEEPSFTWKEGHYIDIYMGVPLARIQYSESHAVFDEKFAPPRSRALARPHIASGTTIPGNTAWEPWKENGTDIGIQVEIDTSAAGFTETPCYFAWLQGPLWHKLAESTEKLDLSQFFPAPLFHIHDPKFNEFTFRLWGPTFDIHWLGDGKKTNQDFIAKFRTFAQKQRLYVCWLGLQPLSHFQTKMRGQL